MSFHPRSVDWESTWGPLEEACHAVIELRSVKSLSGMQLKRLVYSLAGAHPKSYSEDMYNHLVTFFTHHAEGIRTSLSPIQGPALLSGYASAWKTYELGSRVISAIFDYVNDNWIARRTNDGRGVALRAMYHPPSTSSTPSTPSTPSSTTPSAPSAPSQPPTQPSPVVSGVFKISKLALVVWREVVFSPLKESLVYNILDALRRERDGEEIDRVLVQETIGSFVKLGLEKNKPLEVYGATIEVPYCHALREYYAAESAGFLAQNSVQDYLVRAQARVLEETERARFFLDHSSLEMVDSAVSDVLVGDHAAAITTEAIPLVNAILLGGVDSEATGLLNKLYHLLARVHNGFSPLVENLAACIQDKGMDVLSNLGDDATKDPKAYVDALLAHYASFKVVVDTGFESAPLFVAALDKGMRGVVNAKAQDLASSSGAAEPGSSSSSAGKRKKKNTGLPPAPELLALYTDLILRKSSKTQLEDSELEDRLDSVLSVFQYLEDKDVFQKFYAKMLAKRLISSLSVSDDAETAMLSRLKTAAGYEYTSKLQRMFNDIQVSTEMNDSFSRAVEDNKLDVGGIAFSFKVLTKGVWPLQLAPKSFVHPAELSKLIKHFEAFYKNAHSSRELYWMPHLTKGELRTNFLKKDHDLIVTNYQMAILCLFNRGPMFSVSEIAQLVGLDTKVILRNVASLVRCKLLSIVAVGEEEGKGEGDGGEGKEEGKEEGDEGKVEGGGDGGKEEDEEGEEEGKGKGKGKGKGGKKKKGKGGKKKKAPIKLSSSTQLEVNLGFSNKRRRVKVTAALLKESSSEERSSTIKAVDEDRKFYLQAAIVRVMKARKTLQHSLLIAAVVDMAKSRFSPNVSLIKKCVEQLIDKGYLERAADQKGVYNYLA